MEPRNRNSDEIDLLYFFNPLFRLFKRIGAGFKSYGHRLQRNLGLFLAIFLIIAIAGFMLRYILPKSYKTNAVFVSYNLPAGFCSELINSLKDLTRGKNTPILAQQLKLTPEVASSIVSVSTVPMDSIMSLDKTDSTASAFKVRLIVRNQQNIPEVQKGLETFLENNDFALRRREATRKTLEDLRDDLITRINNLDSLKDVLSRSVVPRSNGQGIILGEPVNPIQAYQVQRDYYQQLKEIEEKLSLLRNVEVVQPFMQINTPNYPNFTNYFLYALLFGLIAALLLTPLLGRRR